MIGCFYLPNGIFIDTSHNAIAAKITGDIWDLPPKKFKAFFEDAKKKIQYANRPNNSPQVDAYKKGTWEIGQKIQKIAMTTEKEKLINTIGRAQAWANDAAEQMKAAGVKYQRTRWEMIARLGEIARTLAELKKEIQR